MAVHRWSFFDPTSGQTYVFEQNPNRMSSPFPNRNINAQTTTALGGRTFFIEGNTSPVEWTFGGSIRTKQFYETLRSWVYNDQGTPLRRRIVITDHFGRKINAVLLSFDPQPKRAVNVYWRHDYEIKALVTSVGVPTVDNAPVGVGR